MMRRRAETWDNLLIQQGLCSSKTTPTLSKCVVYHGQGIVCKDFPRWRGGHKLDVPIEQDHTAHHFLFPTQLECCSELTTCAN